MTSSLHLASSDGRPAQHSEQVYLVAQGEALEPSIDEVSPSWQRSANQYRVDPDGREAPRILTSREVNNRREPLDELVYSAQEELDRLYKVVREAGYTLLFCDNTGVAVEHRGDDSDASRFRYWGTWLGGMWSEAIEGTNGIGTCIAEERPVTIHRSQHYRTRHVDLSCSGAPVFGADGRLMAVLDVSAIDPERSERAHALTGALTVTSARAIEERFFRERFHREWVVAIAPPDDRTTAMLLAIDSSQRIAGANRAARAVLLLDDRNLQAGVSLWNIFERDRTLFRRNDSTDTPTRLVVAGSDEPWPKHRKPCSAHAPALGCPRQPAVPDAGPTSARWLAACRHESRARIYRSTSERQHRTGAVLRHRRAVGLSFRAAVQAIGGRITALLPGGKTDRTSQGIAGGNRSLTLGDCIRHGLLGSKPPDPPFPSDDRRGSRTIQAVAALVLGL